MRRVHELCRTVSPGALEPQLEASIIHPRESVGGDRAAGEIAQFAPAPEDARALRNRKGTSGPAARSPTDATAEPETRCSTRSCGGGDERDRTVGLLSAIQALSQLSYIPIAPDLPSSAAAFYAGTFALQPRRPGKPQFYILQAIDRRSRGRGGGTPRATRGWARARPVHGRAACCAASLTRPCCSRCPTCPAARAPTTL